MIERVSDRVGWAGSIPELASRLTLICRYVEAMG
jgi:hypothetical protein